MAGNDLATRACESRPSPKQQYADALRATKRGRFPVVSKERRTLGTRVFASAKEMRRWATLEVMAKQGLIADLDYQPSFEVLINLEKLCTYTADAAYTVTETGERVIEDTKSSGTKKDRYHILRRHAAELYWKIKVKEVTA